MTRYVYARVLFGWSILDTSATPAATVASVFDRCDLHPTDAMAARDAGDRQAELICELLNRDHEMRIAVDEATRRGGA